MSDPELERIFQRIADRALAASRRKDKAKAARVTHCKHGHEWTADNTRYSDGYRRCKACSRESGRRQTAAKARPRA